MAPVRAFFIALFAISSFTAYAADIIIESRTGGQNYSGYQELQGNWLDSNTPAETSKSSAEGLTPQNTIGSRKTTISASPASSPDQIISSARFTPTITTAGNYHVYITFPRAANATPVTILIKSESGEIRKEITQDGWGATGSLNANQWLDLGTYPFSPAGNQYAEMQVTGATAAIDPRNPPQAYADAMRFSTDPVPTAIPAAPAAAAPPQGGQAAASAPAAPKTATPAASNQPPSLPSLTPSAPISWASDLATARADARSQGKKLLVFFYSPDSSRSTDYETKVLNSGNVKTAIQNGYVAVKVNLEVDRQLAAQLQVFRAGTINVYDATGTGLDSITDTPEAAELATRLNLLK